MAHSDIVTRSISDSAVTTAKIADDAVTADKLAASALSYPTIDSLTPSVIENTSTAVVIAGGGFVSVPTVDAINTSGAIVTADSVTFTSATSITATFTLPVDGTYFVRVENNDGLAVRTSTAALTVSDAPTWTTASGSLGTFAGASAIPTQTLYATNATSFAITSGAIATPLTFTTGVGSCTITGTQTQHSAAATDSFTVTATDAEGQTAARAFTMTWSFGATGGMQFNQDFIMATTYIYRDATSDVAVQKATISFWVKKCGQGTSQYIFFCGLTGDYSSYSFYMKFHTDDTIKIVGASPGTTIDYKTNRVFRDPTAWMNIVIKLDMTETGTDRCILYINGVEETSYSTQTAMTGTEWYTGKSGYRQFIGYAPSEGTYSSVVLSHYHYCDGYAYPASSFGETDATSGIWKINTSPSVSYGTNGFFLKMEDRTNLDLDSSGNALTLTTSGTGTATYDNPNNNFCTMNILDNYYLDGTFTNGNNTVATGGGKEWGTSTFGLSAGLWYYESEIVVTAGNSNRIGIAYGPATSASMGFGDRANDYALYSFDGKIYSNSVANTYGDTWSGTGVILGVYIDLNANKLYFAKDGVIMNSGTGFDITAAASTANGAYFPAVADDHSSMSATWASNFGNGYFGTDLISSPEADAGGVGAFKYNPSTGTFDGSSKDFRAICTKNIKAYGG